MQKLYLNGQWVEGQGEPLTKKNPVSGKRIYEANGASAEQVVQAVGHARAAFKGWAKDFDTRLDVIKKFGELLKRDTETLATLISQETGKPLWETRTELAASIGKIDISIKAYHERTGQKVVEVADGEQHLRHRPHGVMAVFGPYNFPLHLPNGHIVPALLAGNTIVFKPSEQTPAVGEKMVALWHETGLPKGVLNLVQGAKEVGQALSSAKIDGLLFTGSQTTGHALHRALSGQSEVILALEMGGNNALIVHDFDDLDAVVNVAIMSAFLSAGQRCTCARRILVKNGTDGDAFIDRFVAVAKNLTIGAYDAEPQPFMGGLVSETAADNLLNAYQKLVDLGAKPLLPMQKIKDGTSLLSPAILLADGDLPDEEYFGPMTVVYRYDDFDDALDKANDTQFGLSCSLVARDKSLYERLLNEARAGVVNFNKPTNGASSALPFGGVGASGNHRPSAYYAADYCAYPVAGVADDLNLPKSLAPGVDLSAQ